MKVKRGFNWLGAARKYRVLINGETKFDLKSNKEIDVEEPNSEYTIQFRTMMFEKSKTYLVQPNDIKSIEVNVNKWITILYIIDAVVIFGVAIYAGLTQQQALIPIVFIPALVAYLGIYYGVLVNDYISVVATNDLDEEVELEEYKELK